MEYNFLLLEDNKLSIQKNKTFLQLTQENIDSLKATYSLISINEIKGNNPLSSKVIELLKDNEVVINFEKVENYWLWPYFGGDQPAPHEVTIKLKREVIE